MPKGTVVAFGLVLGTLLAGSTARAGSEADPSATILERDRLFWGLYNACDTEAMPEYFTGDAEFYHDQGGILLGPQAIADAVKKNLCSNPDFHLRRAAVEGTVHLYLLRDGGRVYGAVLSGEHTFHVRDKGQPEHLTGHARFTHLWLLKDGAWRMARVLSYDHRPAEGN
jgi:hypothetical protein